MLEREQLTDRVEFSLGEWLERLMHRREKHGVELAEYGFIILTDAVALFVGFGMFAFSIVSGRLTDRWGCALTPLSPDVLPLSIALFLLGLG
jgi:hypothetical protein